MLSHSELTTSVLLIDGNAADRAYYTEQLKRSSPDYEIFEAADGQSGLNLYQSRRIDCVILDLALPDQPGFRVLLHLNPIASRPYVAVIVLTHSLDPGIRGLALKNGAYAYLVKPCTSGDDLDKAIQRAVAFVGLLSKEERH